MDCSRTDPHASWSLRFAAGCIDVFFACILALLLSTSTGWFFAERSMAMLDVGAVDSFWKGPVPLVIGLLGTFLYGLPFALLLVLLAEPLTGRSLGKLLLHLYLVSGHSQPCSSRPACWRYFAALAVGPALMVAGLLVAVWQLAALGLVFSLVTFLLSVIVSKDGSILDRLLVTRTLVGDPQR